MPSTPGGVELCLAAASASATAGAGADPHGWDRERTSRLIELWRQRPALYDFTCETYRDRGGRRIAIAEIASLLRAEEHDVVKKMKNLRRQYSRERSLIETGKAAGQHPTFVSSWYYYPKLTFLELFMKPGAPGSTARDAESLEAVESDSGDGDNHCDHSRLLQPDACEWAAAAAEPPLMIAATAERSLFGRQAPVSSNCAPSCFSVGPSVADHSSPQPLAPPHLVDARDWVGCERSRQLPGSPHSDAADDETMRSSESDGRRSTVRETQSSSRSGEGLRQQSDAASPDRSLATGVTSFGEPQGGGSGSEQLAQSSGGGGIRCVPISELNHVRRFKRKRLSTVRSVTAPAAALLSPGSRQRSSLAGGGANASDGSRSRPPPSPAVSTSWDCDDVFGRFVADELRQIADERVKRLTKFKLHALLLEAHGSLPGDSAAASALSCEHSPYDRRNDEQQSYPAT